KSHHRKMLRAVFLVTFLPAALLAGDWNKSLAASYLDMRQKDWSVWPQAKATGGTCVSCHTNMTYLLARPALRRALGESAPTQYETALFASFRARFDQKARSAPSGGVESVLAALLFTLDDPSSADSRKAFDRMWSLQIREGKNAGAWNWFGLDLDPWETEQSPFHGASLAGLAGGAAPAAYRDQPEVRERIAALTAYLQQEWKSQPLHNRITLLWASSKLTEAMTKTMRQETIAELWKKQQPDGSW